MFETLFTSLQPETLLLTANNRLATRICNEHHDYQVAKGLKVWLSIDALPFNSWLQRCWETAQTQGTADALTLLNPSQEQLVWQGIINNSKDNVLLQVNSTAHLAKQAWELLKQWQISLDEPQLTQTPESNTFIHWANEFKKQCREKQWIDNASLIEQINIQILKDDLTIPKKIILIGFIEPTPTMDNLLNILREKNCSIELYSPPKSKTEEYQLSIADVDKEIYTMAEWAKKIIQTEKKPCIGCVIPELNELRSKLERTFQTFFKEESVKAYNISSGLPLANEPIIQTALEILRFKTNALSFSEISYFLHSPFIKQGEEFLKHITCDTDLRELGNTEYTLSSFINFLVQKNYCAKLLKQLQTFQTIPCKTKQKPSEWVVTFNQLLDAVGWPGDRAINSREYQAHQHWENLLNELEKLDLVNSSMSFAHALAQCRQLATQTIFQPQTKDIPPIQVLGILEAVGMPFTHLWIMGLDDQQWPAPAKPNALLPSFLQRQYNMPHSSAQRELHFSKNIHQMFSQNTATLIYSYSKQEDDRQLQASPLIKPYPQLTIDCINNNDTTFNTLALEVLTDETAPVIQKNETVRGGTSILKEQAACPFRAFAKLRLNAKILKEPEEGITAIEKGLLLHRSLELIWKHIRTSEKLNTLINENNLQSIIDDNISKASNEIFQLRDLSKNMVELERKRLTQLVFDWLLMENERSVFDVILCEEWHDVVLKALTIKTKIDRLDHLSNGSYALIDYKTSKTNIRNWFGDRPDEPQLPLYAISAQEPISAIAFAQIRPDEMKFKGVSREKESLPNDKLLTQLKIENVSDDWHDQLQTWKNSLEKLAEDFCNGCADVHPKYPGKTCQYCDLQALCRLYD